MKAASREMGMLSGVALGGRGSSRVFSGIRHI